MDPKVIHQLLSEAESRLAHNPLDASHDLAHAQAVWATAQDLVTHIHQLPNIDVLHLVCLWHDVVVKPVNELHPPGENVSDTADYLKSQLQTLNFPPDFIDATYLALRYHQFDDYPVNLEGKILWDADKLEILGLQRWLSAKRALDSGELPQKTFDSYIQTGLNWLKVLRPKFHFGYSRTLFDHRLQTLTQHPDFIPLTQKYNFNLDTILKS